MSAFEKMYSKQFRYRITIERARNYLTSYVIQDTQRTVLQILFVELMKLTRTVVYDLRERVLLNALLITFKS